MRESMTGGGDGLDPGVAELVALAVGESVVFKVRSGSLREVGGRARTLDELWEPRHVVGLDVGLEDGDDGKALAVSQSDVLVNEVHVRLHDRKPTVALAAEQIGRTRGLVVPRSPRVQAAKRR